MTAMRYEWTPASEPPSHDRQVLVWALDYDDCEFFTIGSYWAGIWCAPDVVAEVTHWCDVEPPKGD